MNACTARIELAYALLSRRPRIALVDGIGKVRVVLPFVCGIAGRLLLLAGEVNLAHGLLLARLVLCDDWAFKRL